MTEIPRTQLAPGHSIAKVINGCWQLTPDHGGGCDSESAIFRQFDELVEHGFTTFDCADIYTGVEELLGRYRRRLSDPDRIQVHTKLVPDKATLHELTAERVDAVIHRSLERLGVDCLDLVQFHWWDYQVPGLELLTDRLLCAQQAGKIRFLGVTNFDTAHVRQLLDQRVPLISLQAQYSLLDRRPEKHMTQLVHEIDVALLPYGVLAGGFLSDKYLGAKPPVSPNRSLTKYRLMIEEAGGWNIYQDLLAVLASIARKHGVSPDLVAARWVLDQPAVKAIILGVGSSSRAKKNLELARLNLDSEDTHAIGKQLERQSIPPGDMYDLERDQNSVHAGIIKTDLQQAPR
jgi:aryl-alcohol dehydrogenase-like predicted oxidoreductase